MLSQETESQKGKPQGHPDWPEKNLMEGQQSSLPQGPAPFQRALLTVASPKSKADDTLCVLTQSSWGFPLTHKHWAVNS